jgi:hypothetical protein
MLRIASLLLCLAGCQREAGSTAPPVAESYRADIATLCEVVARSGADQVPPAERTLLIATWLPGHLQTAEAHDYLVKIGPLVGDAKAAALEAEAARVGLTRCALAAEWRTPTP